MTVTPNKGHNCENIALHLCHVLHLQGLRMISDNQESIIRVM